MFLQSSWAIACLLLMFTSMFAVVVLDPYQSAFVFPESIPADIRSFFEYLSAFGHGTGAVLCIVLVWTLDPRHSIRAHRLLLASIATGAACLLLKYFLHRMRPAAWAERTLLPGDHWNILESSFQSFPSAHTAEAFTLAWLLSSYYPRSRWVFFALAAITGLQRVLSNHHYFSDVLAGAAIGILSANVWLYFLAGSEAADALPAASATIRQAASSPTARYSLF